MGFTFGVLLRYDHPTNTNGFITTLQRLLDLHFLADILSAGMLAISVALRLIVDARRIAHVGKKTLRICTSFEQITIS